MDLINIFLIIVGIINLLLSLIIYFNTKKVNKISLLFSALVLNVSLWSIAMAFFRNIVEIDNALIALKILYVVPLFIPILFLYFVKFFINKTSAVFQARYYFLWTIILALFVSLTDKFIVGVKIPIIGEKIIFFGEWYALYIIHFLVFFGLSFIFLIGQYFAERKNLVGEQIKFLFLGTLVSSCVGMVTNLILPWFGFFTLNWLGNIMTVFFVGFILYAILKYQLFNTKIIATEVFIIFILITLFVDLLFVSSVTELVIKNLIVISVSFLSYLIIRGVYDEIRTREQIEKLADDLKIANVHLRKSDQQKSEFVSIASHQLRAPIASLKGYSSMVLDGSYGEISPEIKEVAKKLFRSSQELSLIIDDFLNLSRIERGKIEFIFTENDLAQILQEVVNELKPNAEEKKLKLDFEKQDGKYSMNIDGEKIKQIMINLIDNAIKYTNEGFVKVSLFSEQDKFIIKIQDTGIGIPKNSVKKLFKKFSRLENANEASIKGTGLGLYLAKQVIEAHNGKISADSLGLNKGSVFTIELPIK